MLRYKKLKWNFLAKSHNVLAPYDVHYREQPSLSGEKLKLIPTDSEDAQKGIKTLLIPQLFENHKMGVARKQTAPSVDRRTLLCTILNAEPTPVPQSFC